MNETSHLHSAEWNQSVNDWWEVEMKNSLLLTTQIDIESPLRLWHAVDLFEVHLWLPSPASHCLHVYFENDDFPRSRPWISVGHQSECNEIELHNIFSKIDWSIQLFYVYCCGSITLSVFPGEHYAQMRKQMRKSSKELRLRQKNRWTAFTAPGICECVCIVLRRFGFVLFSLLLHSECWELSSVRDSFCFFVNRVVQFAFCELR